MSLTLISHVTKCTHFLNCRYMGHLANLFVNPFAYARYTRPYLPSIEPIIFLLPQDSLASIPSNALVSLLHTCLCELQSSFTKSLSFCNHSPDNRTVWTKAKLTGSYVKLHFKAWFPLDGKCHDHDTKSKHL